MFSRCLFYSLILALLVLNPAIAQTSLTESQTDGEKAEEEREKNAVELVEDIASEISLLKAPENRALVLAPVADLIWNSDQKRVRQLFRQTADELVAVNNASTVTPGMLAMFDYFRTAAPRRDILLTIGARFGTRARVFIPDAPGKRGGDACRGRADRGFKAGRVAVRRAARADAKPLHRS